MSRSVLASLSSVVHPLALALPALSTYAKKNVKAVSILNRQVCPKLAIF
jgi:hypothetical protein